MIILIILFSILYVPLTVIFGLAKKYKGTHSPAVMRGFSYAGRNRGRLFCVTQPAHSPTGPTQRQPAGIVSASPAPCTRSETAYTHGPI